MAFRSVDGSQSSRQSTLSSQGTFTRRRRGDEVKTAFVSVSGTRGRDEPTPVEKGSYMYTLESSHRSQLPYVATPLRNRNQINLLRSMCFRHRVPPGSELYSGPWFDDGEGGIDFGKPLPLLGGRYKLCRVLGYGGFSQLIECEDLYDKNRCKRAIKIMRRHFGEIGNQEYGRLLEAGATGAGKHVNIVQCYGKFEFYTHVCLVFELLGQTAEEIFLVRPSERIDFVGQTRTASLNSLKHIVLSMFQALTYLERRKILHADIKPGNIMIDTIGNQLSNRGPLAQPLHSTPPSADVTRATLVDLGNAFSYQEIPEYCKDFEVQSLGYRAPEVLCEVPFDGKIDVWSTGVMLAECASGNRLIPARNQDEALALITSLLGPLPSSLCNFSAREGGLGDFQETEANPRWSRMKILSSLSNWLGRRDPHLLHFLAECLELDPKRRLTPFGGLSHPFLQSIFPLGFLLPEKTEMSSETTSDTGDQVCHPSSNAAGDYASQDVKQEKSSLLSIFEGVSPKKNSKHSKRHNSRPLTSLETLATNNQSSTRKKSARGFRSLIRK